MHDDANAQPTQPPTAPPGLTVEITRVDRTIVLCPHGEIDLHSGDTLQGAIDTALATDATEIVVDLAACGFIDSSGLAVLVRLFNELEDAPDRRLQLRPGPPQVQRVFEITGLDQVFSLLP